MSVELLVIVIIFSSTILVIWFNAR